MVGVFPANAEACAEAMRAAPALAGVKLLAAEWPVARVVVAEAVLVAALGGDADVRCPDVREGTTERGLERPVEPIAMGGARSREKRWLVSLSGHPGGSCVKNRTRRLGMALPPGIVV